MIPTKGIKITNMISKSMPNNNVNGVRICHFFSPRSLFSVSDDYNESIIYHNYGVSVCPVCTK